MLYENCQLLPLGLSVDKHHFEFVAPFFSHHHLNYLYKKCQVTVVVAGDKVKILGSVFGEGLEQATMNKKGTYCSGENPEPFNNTFIIVKVWDVLFRDFKIPLNSENTCFCLILQAAPLYSPSFQLSSSNSFHIVIFKSSGWSQLEPAARMGLPCMEGKNWRCI